MNDDPWALQRWAFGVKTGNPTRKSILSMLAMMADSTTARCEAKQETIAKGVEVASKSTVAGHLRELEKQHVIARREQRRIDGGRRADEYLLRAPWIEAWPDGEPLPTPPTDSGEGGPGAGSPPSPAGGQGTTTGNDHASKQEEAARADAWPDDLPPELHEPALQAGKILKRTALERGQKREVTRAAVGHAVLTYPDRDHVKVAREVEAWLLHGKGSTKSCADIVSRYRRFLESSDPMAGPPRPSGGGGAPRSSATSANLRDMAADLRSRGQ